MSRNPPTSKEELDAELQAILLDAHGNGVDVRGAYDCKNGDGHPDWEVVVTEVEKRSGSD